MTEEKTDTFALNVQADNREKSHDGRKRSSPSDLQYSLEETPPWYLCAVLGFQHYLTMIGSTLAVPLILSPAMCIGDDDQGQVAKSEIIGTAFFTSGLITLLQSTLGSRLPIVQGNTFAFLTPTFAILSLPKWQCPGTGASSLSVHMNATDSLEPTLNGVTAAATAIDSTELWQLRMREIQGAIIVSSLFEVLIGLSGAVGFLMRYIGPITIAPTITLVGLALFGAASDFCARQWWIALMTIALLALFSQYLRNVEPPFCSFKRGVGCTRKGYPIFKLFPVILAILVSWFICAILTWASALTDDPNKWGYYARIDTRYSVFRNSKWFRFPYPFQWGIPTFSVGTIFGMLSGVLAGMMESIGDYYACARLAGAPPPPIHAINRGIFIEGIGCVLAGIWGTGNGSTSYSENIGAIGITKVGSRRVVQAGTLIMMAVGVLGKCGALFVSIPDPVIGGAFMVMFGMVTAVGISNLQFVDLNSSRNLFIIGFSIFFGLSLPQWMAKHPGEINVGVPEVDQILTVLLTTSMFVGGVVAFVLDNSIPGTPEERGLAEWRKEAGGSVSSGKRSLQSYDLPFGMGLLRRMTWARYFPLCPTFRVGSEPSNGENEIVKGEGVTGRSDGNSYV